MVERFDQPRIKQTANEVKAAYDYAVERQKEISSKESIGSKTPNLDKIIQSLTPQFRSMVLSELEFLKMQERARALGRVLGLGDNRWVEEGLVAYNLFQRERNDLIIRRMVARTLIQDEQEMNAFKVEDDQNERPDIDGEYREI